MFEDANFMELWPLYGTPNAELDDEQLKAKARGLREYAKAEKADGYDFGFYRSTLDAVACEEELDRRHGIVRTHEVPKWPPVSTRRRSLKRWTKRK